VHSLISQHRRIVLLAALVLAARPTPGFGQQTASDSQRYRVQVPFRLIVISGSPDVSIIHDQTDNDQVFPPQPWFVRGTWPFGVTVTLATTQAFTHTTATTLKRDARLDLRIVNTQGFGRWRVNVPTDRTNYAAGDERAVVQASSNFFGRAELALTVTFLTVQYADLAAGNYELTVVGTATANF
jgi:hypothetical protein